MRFGRGREPFASVHANLLEFLLRVKAPAGHVGQAEFVLPLIVACVISVASKPSAVPVGHGVDLLLAVRTGGLDHALADDLKVLFGVGALHSGKLVRTANGQPHSEQDEGGHHAEKADGIQSHALRRVDAAAAAAQTIRPKQAFRPAGGGRDKGWSVHGGHDVCRKLVQKFAFWERREHCEEKA